ncbi:MAG: radical SAM protein [Candidatus Competibacteraceae bacterium]|nr:MAG: radical SAM protein [Candidatus Competibacteraceae bacterium]
MTRPYPPLRIKHWLPSVEEALGPGRRAVVWVQGCSLRCPGCMVPETWSTQGGQSFDPVDLAHQVLGRESISGVTVSGGEPTEQAEAVAALLAAVKQAGKNTWVYSGYTLEELLDRADPAVDALLSFTDVLVDGRYEAAQGGRYRWRGSANQRILHLTEAIAVEDRPGGVSRVEITLNARGEMVLVGIPPPHFLHRFRQALARQGVVVHTPSPWKITPNLSRGNGR